jgi:hypothetical protein
MPVVSWYNFIIFPCKVSARVLLKCIRALHKNYPLNNLEKQLFVQRGTLLHVLIVSCLHLVTAYSRE